MAKQLVVIAGKDYKRISRASTLSAEKINSTAVDGITSAWSRWAKVVAKTNK